MNTLQQLRDELTFEYTVTKKFFEKFPEDKNDYTPHPKSMKMMGLVTHIASIFGWAAVMLKTTELDIAEADESEKVENKLELIKVLDKEFMFFSGVEKS